MPDAAELRARNVDVAIVGAPFDDAVSHRPGARFGPRAIREAQYTSGSIHSLQLGVEPFEILTVVDAGDANIIPAWIDRAHAMIYRKVHEVAATGAIPIVLGGDHSITWPSATAVADIRRPGSIGIVHFDAHADTANDDWGVLAGHGTPMRRLIESGAVKGSNFVQVGLRGYWPPVETFEWMKEHGLRWHLMREIEERGAEAVIDDAIAEALDGPDAIYISVDIDVIDPGSAPGTGTPEPGGLPAAGAAARRPADRRQRRDRGHGHRRGVPAVRPRRGHRDGGQPRRAGGHLGAGRQAAGRPHRSATSGRSPGERRTGRGAPSPASTTSTSPRTRATSTCTSRWRPAPAARSWSWPSAPAASPCRSRPTATTSPAWTSTRRCWPARGGRPTPRAARRRGDSGWSRATPGRSGSRTPAPSGLP